MHYTTERHYVMTWTERWVVRIFQPLADSLVLYNARGQWRKSIRPTHSNKEETEGRRAKWFDQDPTIRGSANCCVPKEGFSNPRFPIYHKATLSNISGFSQLYIITVTELLKESDSVSPRTPAQRTGSHWCVTTSNTSQHMLIQRGENSWSSGEKPRSAPGQKRWGIEGGPFPLQARNGVNDQHTRMLLLT